MSCSYCGRVSDSLEIRRNHAAGCRSPENQPDLDRKHISKIDARYNNIDEDKLEEHNTLIKQLATDTKYKEKDLSDKPKTTFPSMQELCECGHTMHWHSLVSDSFIPAASGCLFHKCPCKKYKAKVDSETLKKPTVNQPWREFIEELKAQLPPLSAEAQGDAEDGHFELAYRERERQLLAAEVRADMWFSAAENYKIHLDAALSAGKAEIKKDEFKSAYDCKTCDE